MQKCMVPSFFCTRTMRLVHGLLQDWITLLSFICLSWLATSWQTEMGIRWGGCLTGVAPLVSIFISTQSVSSLFPFFHHNILPKETIIASHPVLSKVSWASNLFNCFFLWMDCDISVMISLFTITLHTPEWSEDSSSLHVSPEFCHSLLDSQLLLAGLSQCLFHYLTSEWILSS